MLNFAGDQRMETDNRAVAHGNISLRRVRLLRLQRVPDQKAIKLRLPASERSKCGYGKLLDVERSCHDSSILD